MLSTSLVKSSIADAGCVGGGQGRVLSASSSLCPHSRSVSWSVATNLRPLYIEPPEAVLPLLRARIGYKGYSKVMMHNSARKQANQVRRQARVLQEWEGEGKGGARSQPAPQRPWKLRPAGRRGLVGCVGSR